MPIAIKGERFSLGIFNCDLSVAASCQRRLTRVVSWLGAGAGDRPIAARSRRPLHSFPLIEIRHSGTMSCDEKGNRAGIFVLQGFIFIRGRPYERGH